MQEVVCFVCGRRSALAPGAALRCPSCGAPVAAPALSSMADDDSATRPSIPPAPAVDEITRVAMPVSAANTAESSSAADVTADYPMPPAPERTQTAPASAMPATEPQTQPVSPAQPAYPPAAWSGAPAESASAPPSVTPPPPRKRNPFAIISILALVLLLLAIIAAGVLYANGRLPFFGVTPTPAANATATLAPTATATSILTTFTDSERIYSIGYPNGWLLTIRNASGNQPGLAIFSNPTTGANFNVGTVSTIDTPAQQIVEQELALLGQKAGIANRSGPEPVIIGGETWVQESGDVTIIVNQKPVNEHAIAMAVIHGAHTVYLLLLAPADTYPAAETFFQQMLHSFQFLS